MVFILSGILILLILFLIFWCIRNYINKRRFYTFNDDKEDLEMNTIQEKPRYIGRTTEHIPSSSNQTVNQRTSINAPHHNDKKYSEALNNESHKEALEHFKKVDELKNPPHYFGRKVINYSRKNNVLNSPHHKNISKPSSNDSQMNSSLNAIGKYYEPSKEDVIYSHKTFRTPIDVPGKKVVSFHPSHSHRNLEVDKRRQFDEHYNVIMPKR